MCRGLSKHMADSSEAVLPVRCFFSKLQRGLRRVGAEDKDILVILITAYTFLFIYFWLHWVFIEALGLSLVAVCRLLISAASLVAKHRL